MYTLDALWPTVSSSVFLGILAYLNQSAHGIASYRTISHMQHIFIQLVPTSFTPCGQRKVVLYPAESRTDFVFRVAYCPSMVPT
jgi:hypothetical protein